MFKSPFQLAVQLFSGQGEWIRGTANVICIQLQAIVTGSEGPEKSALQHVSRGRAIVRAGGDMRPMAGAHRLRGREAA